MLRNIKAVSLRDEARMLGLVMPAGFVATVDVLETQLPDVQAAIDRGDVSVEGMSITVKAKGK